MIIATTATDNARIAHNDLPHGATTKLDINGRKQHKFYSVWQGMINRCYRTYQTATVCDDWLTLSKFKAWFDLNYIENTAIDIDLFYGTEYSPDTACFVPQSIKALIKSINAGIETNDGYQIYKAQRAKIKYQGIIDTLPLRTRNQIEYRYSLLPPMPTR